MQDLQHIQPSGHVGNRSRSVSQMNRMGNQDLRKRAHSFEGMIDTESNQQRATRMELSESNLDIQRRALPPLPTAGMESGHAASLNPVPNPHSIEYTMNPEVQMSHSQFIPPVQARKATQYHGQNSQQLPRSYQQQDNQVRSHAYPSQQAHTTNHLPHRQQPTSVATKTHQKMQQSVHQQQQQMALPPPPPFIEEQPTHSPSGRGQRFRGHHSKHQKQQQQLQHPLSLQQHPGVAQSMIQFQHQGMGGRYKPEISDHHQRQQSLPDEQGILPTHLQQNFNHEAPIIPQHVPNVNQSTPNLAFNAAVSQQEPNGGSNNEATPAGFRRIPMTGGHTPSQYDDEILQDTVTAWEQVDQIQQQFELDMQNMLTPRVTDEMERGRDQFLFQHDTLNLNDSINSTSSVLSHTHSMVSPVANVKPPNGFTITSSLSSTQAPPPVRAKPPKVAPKMNPKSTQKRNSFDSERSSSQGHKRRPSLPDNDPKKPQLKKGKYPKAVWVQTSMNRAIESSSDSESDSDMSMDTVIAGPAGDTESLKSSHV